MEESTFARSVMKTRASLVSLNPGDVTVSPRLVTTPAVITTVVTAARRTLLSTRVTHVTSQRYVMTSRCTNMAACARL